MCVLPEVRLSLVQLTKHAGRNCWGVYLWKRFPIELGSIFGLSMNQAKLARQRIKFGKCGLRCNDSRKHHSRQRIVIPLYKLTIG